MKSEKWKLGPVFLGPPGSAVGGTLHYTATLLAARGSVRLMRGEHGLEQVWENRQVQSALI